MEKSHQLISDTSKFVSYLRSFSDIPEASNIYETILRLAPQDTQRRAGLNYKKFHWLAPIVEARYKSINCCLREKQFPVVIELASGFSTRFLEGSSHGVSDFFDTDLAPLISIKGQALEKLSLSMPMGIKLELCSLDVMSDTDWRALEALLPQDRPVAIVNEGLFQYFERPELLLVAKQIHKVLKRCGGTWITPDFSTKAQYQRYYDFSPDMHELSTARSSATNRDLLSYAFEDRGEIAEFFKSVGFQVSKQPMFSDPSKLASAKALNLDIDKIVNFFHSELFVWVLST